MARPSKLTRERGRAICLRICAGQSLRSICADARQVGRSTVFDWLAKAQEDGSGDLYRWFRNQYACARQIQAELLAEDIVAIADADADVEDLSMVDVMVTRNRIDARKWMATRLLPKAYGDKLEVEEKRKLKPGEFPPVRVVIEGEDV